MDRVCIYLRKSRADEELEKTLGHGETLAKHRKALLRYANEKHLNIVKIYEELISGESIIHRPEMLQLLKDIEKGLYDAVLVMDIQRLGRGDMQDQGLILKTFKDSNTKIITPQKTYDLSNDFDEEYTEFEAFMSRKELKMINRRMQGGRVRSIEDGNYIGTNPPYGYLIENLKRGRTLIPNPEQAPIVEMIFDMYVNQQMGAGTIAHELNKLGYKTYTGKDWYPSAIVNMIKNPVYIGKITWKKKCSKKSADPNKKRDTKTRDKSEWIIVDGKHIPLIKEDIFNQAQLILGEKYHVPYQIVNGARNPLAGIIVCKICGSKMILRPYADRAPHILCNKKCGNKSSRFDYIEQKTLQALNDYIATRELEINSIPPKPKNNKALEKQKDTLIKEIDTLNTQKGKLHDLLEQGIYDVTTFIERSNNITKRIDAINEKIDAINEKISTENKFKNDYENIKILKNVYDLYMKTNDVTEKNNLLKSSIDYIEYYKEKNQRGDDFTLILHPKVF